MVGTVESRQRHQMHLVELGANKSPSGKDMGKDMGVRSSTEGSVLRSKMQGY